MTVHMALSILLIGGMLGISSSNECMWDDAYETAIADVRGGNEEQRAEGKRLLRRGMWSWHDLDKYAEVRVEARRTMEKARSAIRMEIGYEKSGGYDVIWAAETSKGVQLFRRVGEKTKRLTLSSRMQREYRRVLDSTKGQQFHSYANLAVDDGPVYFVSGCTKGSMWQFAFYGPPLESWEQGDFSELSASAAKELRIIGWMWELGRQEGDVR